MSKKVFRANGKLLISGEYFVLDGAMALAVPTQLGQTMEVTENLARKEITWSAKTVANEVWFTGTFAGPDFHIIQTTELDTAKYLQKILQKASELNPTVFAKPFGYHVVTKLEFPRNWGLGSSSTLIHNVAQWVAVDPFELLRTSFGGSGYDLACAGAEQAITYQINDGVPTWVSVDFHPAFHENLYFIHLGKKQNSREGIARYREKVRHQTHIIQDISELTKAFLDADKLVDFQKVMLEHEHLVASMIQLPFAKDLYFKAFNGTIKSLGAWGGDFVLAATTMREQEMRIYCEKEGHEVWFRYEDLLRFSI